MKPRTLVALVLVLAGAGMCVRLGFWQVTRWHEKRALNAALRAALTAEPLKVYSPPPPLGPVEKRRIEAFGWFDEKRQVLLSGRVRAQLPGVEVVTPLILAGDSTAVLVDRGWLYAPDAVRARAQDYRERPRAVVGIAHAIPRGRSAQPMMSLERDSSLTLWSAHTLELDSLRVRFPYAIAPYLLVELPGKGVPDKPLRGMPQMLDEFMHVSYATQWFLFAAILLGGSAALAWSNRRGRRSRDDLLPLDPLP